MEPNRLFSLAGKTALVTGSSAGLGFGMARGLASAGAAVVLNGRDAAKLEAAAKALADEGFDIRAIPFDVSSEEAVQAAFAKLDGQGAVIDILVNNAGNQIRKPMLDVSTEEWRNIMDTHVTAAFQMGREAARRMIARGQGGKIINIGSLASEVARATIAPYTAAKGALKMLTRAMAAEWARHNIQANAIGPGYIESEMTKPLIADAKFSAWVMGRTPSGRWGKPDDLVGVTVFLASAASDYVNGQIIYVDGGLLAVI